MYIDCHVHCRDSRKNDGESVKHALIVAKDSGLDAIFDMPNTSPAIINRKTVEERLETAYKISSPVFYGIHIGLTKDPKQIEESVWLHEDYFPKTGEKFGVIGFKTYAGKTTGDLGILNPKEQFRIHKTLADLDYRGVHVLHCERYSEIHDGLWNPKSPFTHLSAHPKELEISSIKENIEFAMKAGYKGHLHFTHVSCPESVDLVNSARGYLDISCAATPPHLLLWNIYLMNDKGEYFIVLPPLRDLKDMEALFEKFKNREIDILSSDHAPHTKEDKLKNHSSGIPNLASWPDFTEILKKKGINQELLDDVAFHNINRIYKTDIKRADRKIISHQNEYLFDPYDLLKKELR